MQFRKAPLEGGYLIELRKRDDEKEFAQRVLRLVSFKSTIADRNEGRSARSALSATAGGGSKGSAGSQGRVLAGHRQSARGLHDLPIWFGAEMNEDNRLMMYVPRGFRHGFNALTDNVETSYLNSAFYAPEGERGLRRNDSAVRIEWLQQPQEMSNKDRKARSQPRVSRHRVDAGGFYELRAGASEAMCRLNIRGTSRSCL
jgi:dTDP-4-dehydrorhamnose 3,5-epimerase